MQATVGFGLAVLSVPILSLIDADLAPVPQLLISLPLSALMAWRERQHLDLRGVGWVLAGRIPGAIIGFVVLVSFADSQRAIDIVIGTVVLGAVLVLASGVRVRRNALTQFTAGTLSGISGLLASIGGPPLALLYRDAKGATIRASLAAVFTMGIVITITTRTIAGEITATDLRVAVLLFPALLVGYAGGQRLAGRFEGKPLRVAILVMSAIAALGLFVRSAT